MLLERLSCNLYSQKVNASEITTHTYCYACLRETVKELNPFRSAHGRGTDILRAHALKITFEEGHFHPNSFGFCSDMSVKRVKDDLNEAGVLDGWTVIDREPVEKAIRGTSDGVERYFEDEYGVRGCPDSILVQTDWVSRIPEVSGYEFEYWERSPRLIRSLNEAYEDNFPFK